MLLISFTAVGSRVYTSVFVDIFLFMLMQTVDGGITLIAKM